MTNRLASSASLYLRQHADNPVDWHEWGPEALALAEALGRPVLLSVGYSACHWCHVMAHESFEDPEIARLMNEWFVNVKVDREERPDVDALYMEAVQRMTGSGGWPMTVFLTPQGEPFYGGTYFPPEPRGGMASLPQVLRAVHEAWANQEADVRAAATELKRTLERSLASARPGDGPSAADIERAEARVLASFDALHGGFGGAPKFPPHGSLRFLLGRAARDRRPETLRALTVTLDAMARGGLHDHLGGGFHRYAVDASWTVPHFEKMLYDNAQLLYAYAAAWKLTGHERYRAVATSTCGYLLREMRDPAGPFWAAQDADTEDGEGASFTWTREQMEAALGGSPGLAEAAIAWFGVTDRGNFEGATVLTERTTVEALASNLGTTPGHLAAQLEAAREALLGARSRRAAPATDTKLIVEWNGLAIEALAVAGAALALPGAVDGAAGAAESILGLALRDGGLARTWTGGQAGAPGFLEDYAALANGLIALYEATFEERWLTSALTLAEEMIDRFSARDGGFYRTGPLHESLIARQKDVLDASLPSGNAQAAFALERLAAFTARRRYADAAEGALGLAWSAARQLPEACGYALAVLDDRVHGPCEIAVVGVGDRCEELLRTVREAYVPGAVSAWKAADHAPSVVRLLDDRRAVGGVPTAYVCHRGTCSAPIHDPVELRERLAGCSAAPSAPESPS